MKNARRYWVDGELGRFEFATYQVRLQEKTVYNTARELFPPLRCWEWYTTTGFKEIALMYGATETSYAKTARLINRVRHQEDATPSTTLRDVGQREGTKVLDCLERTTTEILAAKGLSPEGRPIQNPPATHRDVAVIPPEDVTRAIEACELSPDEQTEVRKNAVLYELASESVNISIDDVVVKKQKEQRTRSGPNDAEQPGAPKDSRKYVHTTVAHIQHGEKTYTISGPSVPAVLRCILGFLLKNELLQYRLQWFVDGQKTLHAAILRAFSWCPNRGLLLDWYHVDDKCHRQLSLAMKGRNLRNDVLQELTQFLWGGMVDKAIVFLQGLRPEHLKDPDAIRVLIGYIDRNRPYLPCSAVRKQLGLRNSSNIGEKMNDLLVSARQKHNGMSWSPDGSVTLAALTAMKRNNEYHLWFEYQKLELTWAA